MRAGDRHLNFYQTRDNLDLLASFRAFRILPLYYVALACFTVLVLVFHLGSDGDAYAGRLPYFLLYLNELAPDGRLSRVS